MKKLLVLLTLTSTQIQANSLKLGATEWCPYTCSSLDNNGIVSEYIQTLAKKNNINIEIKFLPWNRAVIMAQAGAIDGLLTGVKEEAKKLHFTQTPTMYYRSCAFTTNLKAKKIPYSKIQNSKLAYISSYSYGNKIDQVILKDKLRDKKVHMEIKGTNTVTRLMNLVTSKRVDYFVEDEKVARYHLGNKIKSVFCGESNPFYLGVNGQKPKGLELIKVLNKELKNNKELLEKIIYKTLNSNIADIKKSRPVVKKK